MRFYRDDPRLVWVDYYFVPKGTPYVPYSTPFKPRWCWDSDHAGWLPDELGEVWTSSHPWRNGSKVGDAAGTGLVCGTADEWAFGLSVPPATPVPRDTFGTPLCCPRVVCPARSLWCRDAGACVPQHYTLGAVAIGGRPMAFPAGELMHPMVFTFVNPCFGERFSTIATPLILHPVLLVLQVGPAGRVTLTASIPGLTLNVWRQRTPWDYTSTLWLDSAGPDGLINWQPSVLLTPM